MFAKSLPALGFLKYLFLGERASVIIPCFNEATTVEKVVRVARSSPVVDEVIVVDDGSTDGSAAAARRAGARVFRHARNKGKGAAVLSGARVARNEVLLFLDADFVNVSKQAIEALALPIIEGEAEFCKASFERSGGRVTELTAKPLLKFFFPEVSLQQPLSGQFAIRKDFLLSLDLDPGWGVDLSVVLESIKRGEQVIEVNIGYVKHKNRSLTDVSKTAHAVIQIILQRAGMLANKHRLIVFDFDNTLIAQSSISVLAEKLGFKRRLRRERERYYRGEITEGELTKRIAYFFKGTPVHAIEATAGKLKKKQFADETLAYLKRMGYKTAVVSYAFRQIISECFPKNIDFIVSPVLLEKKGRLLGRASIPPYRDAKHVFCKGKATKALIKKVGVKPEETIAVGDSESDDAMLLAAGTPVIVNGSKKDFPAIRITALSEVIVIAS
ncbi:MAG: HAD-IB family phosphatase [Candidatus Micrarchaeota archaeon]